MIYGLLGIAQTLLGAVFTVIGTLVVFGVDLEGPSAGLIYLGIGAAYLALGKLTLSEDAE